MSVLSIETAEVFAPLLEPARYKGAWGGRGSGKSHQYAENLVEDSVLFPGMAGEGLRALCVREVQKSLKQSAKRLIEQKLTKFGLGEKDGFKVYESVIKTPGDGIIEFHGMQDHTAESVKSFEGFQRAFIEEAQTISITSLNLLRPTIRWEDKTNSLESEIWASWNPRRRTDPIDVKLRGDEFPSNTNVVNSNWSDNPWFPDVLEKERQDCLRTSPDQYEHIWEGGYATVLEGAYFAKHIQIAKTEGRVSVVACDPLMSYKAFFDIGGTGAKADAVSIWIAQFVGKQILVLDYYEAVGQPLATHVEWLRNKGYTSDKTTVWLPHDGNTQDKVYDVSYKSYLNQAGYDVEVVPNQGKGAASARIESVRRTFTNAWFNKSTTDGGLAALGWYHEKKDENRGIGLGPDHDWSSHGSDAYGLLSIVYEQQNKKVKPNMKPLRKTTSWMS